MKEQDILHQNGDYWIKETRSGYAVFKEGTTHSTSIECYGDLSIAIARCDYLARRNKK